MKIKYFISLAMAVTLMTACSNEEDPDAHIRNGMLQATVEGNASSARAGFDKDGAFYWSAGDRIGVTTSTSTTSFSALALSDGVGKASGSFNGEVTGDIEGYAVYPYSDSHAMNGSTLTYQFPASYTYTTVDTDYFSPAQGQGNSFNPAMWGKITNGSVGLKHLGGVFCIKVEKLPVGEGLKLTLTTDKKINGTYTVNLNADSAKLEAQSAGNEEEKTVTITFSNNTDNTSGVFYIPVPTGTYENVRLKILEGITEKANVACGNYTIERRDLKQLLISNGTITGGEEKTVADVSKVANALANSNAVSVTSEVSGTNNTISLPAQTAVVPVRVAFQKIASDAKISFTDGAAADASPVKDLTISIPAGVEPSIDCTMEKSTVTLSSNAGTATYNEVTAATAENTLIIDKGVTVKTLKVKKGNVRVKKGATITAIARTEGNQSVVKIYKEEDSEIPKDLDSNIFTVLPAEIADMEAIAKNGGTYTLASDMVLSAPLVVENTMTLYLNGHSIKPKAEGLDQVLNTKDALILVRRGADLTINDNGGGSIDYNGITSVSAAVKLTDSNDENGENKEATAKLTVNGGTLKGYYWGICGNGTRHGTEITITGGIIIAASADGGTGIFHPQEGTLKVTGGEITGGSGIEMRSGTLTVSGGKISSTAQSFAKNANGNGTTMTGVAVAVSQHVTQKKLSVTITGGSLTGLYALYEEDLQGEPYNNISLSVTGGTFTGEVFSKDCSAFVKGGTFSDIKVMDYLATEADVNVMLNKDCTIKKALNIAKGQTVVINLNNCKLTIDDASACNEVSGKLKLIGGKISDGVKGIGLAFNNAQLELDDVAYDAPATSNGIFNDKNIQNATLIIKRSSVKSGYYAIGTNALTNPVGSINITLENSTFTADETALMVNIPATVNVTGCTFTGGWQGVFLRGSTTKLTDCSINLKFDSNYETSNVASGATTWGGGNNAPAAALTMGNRSKSAYDYPTNVTLINTTFSNTGTDKNSKDATQYPAIYIDADNAKENQGVTFTYDAASQTSFKESGKGLVINENAKVTLNGPATDQ